MRHTKLIETLRTLHAGERRRWLSFVLADFINKNQKLRQIACFILAGAPGFDGPEMNKRTVFAHIYGPNEKYSELKLNNLISDLYALLLRFLAAARQDQDEIERQYHSTMALLDRNLDKLAATELEKFRLLLDRSPLRNAEWYRQEYRWWEAAEILWLRQGRRQAGEHLHRQAEAGLTAQVLEKLRLHITALNRGALAVIKAEEQQAWLQHLHIPPDLKDALAATPAVYTYLAAQQLLEQSSIEAFHHLLRALNEHGAVLNGEERKALYQCALNFCIRRINGGQPEAYADALHLYREQIRLGLLLHKGSISQWTYKNIATAGLHNGAFEWTEAFLHEYKNFLPPAERANAFTYNLASMYFEKKDYAMALKMLQDVEFTDFTYQLGAKTILLKIFYAQGEVDALNALIDSIRQLLRRNRSLSAFGKSINLNFLTALRHLCRWQSSKNVLPARQHMKRRDDLETLVRDMHPLANKDWLLKMLAI